jgi:predicted NAD-dependent protein-ADP-ribosyltransferase YbiA (DUF1768 family)
MQQTIQIVVIVHFHSHFVAIKTNINNNKQTNKTQTQQYQPLIATPIRRQAMRKTSNPTAVPNRAACLRRKKRQSKTNQITKIFKNHILYELLRKFESITKHSQSLLATTLAVVVLLPNTLFLKLTFYKPKFSKKKTRKQTSTINQQ